MLFRQHEQLHALGTISGFLRYPLPLAEKARFVRLMLRTFAKTDWSDWLDARATDLIDSSASPPSATRSWPAATDSGGWIGPEDIECPVLAESASG